MNLIRKIVSRAISAMFRRIVKHSKVAGLSNYLGGVLFDDCMRWDFIAVAVPKGQSELEQLQYMVVMPVDYTLHGRQ